LLGITQQRGDCHQSGGKGIRNPFHIIRFNFSAIGDREVNIC